MIGDSRYGRSARAAIEIDLHRNKEYRGNGGGDPHLGNSFFPGRDEIYLHLTDCSDQAVIQ